jgi:hypothetical protein
MKKIVVFSVLLALLSAAVFADDDSGWAIGFTGQLARDFFYSTKASGEWEQKITPNSGAASSSKGILGDYIKGSSNMWTQTGIYFGDQRLIVSLSNNGDHHKVYIDAKLDDSWIAGFTLMSLINGSAADWEFSGDTGASGAAVVFDGKVGTGRYGGFVSDNALWGPHDYLGYADRNFFGVQTKTKFQQSDNISTVDIDGSPWRPVYALGATFNNNIRLAIGSTFGWGDDLNGINADGATPAEKYKNAGYNNPTASASKVKGGFMLSGRDLGPLTFDLFYAINGADKNTVVRGTGKWENLLGVYLGLNIVENLGLSGGFTGNFVQNETAQEQDKNGAWVTYDTTNPFWAGIDIKVKFSGIDKMGITFNNNLSLASAKSEELAKEAADRTGYNRIVGLDGSSLNLPKDTSENQSWTAWTAILGVSYSLTDNLSVSLTFFNQLKIFTVETEDKATSGTTITTKDTTTNNDFRTVLLASYGVGNVSFGLGVQLFIDNTSVESEYKVTASGGGGTATGTSSLSVVQFAVPIFFKVSI